MRPGRRPGCNAYTLGVFLIPFRAVLEPVAAADAEKAVQQLASNRGSDYRGASVSQAKRARSSAGEHFLDMEGVTGSIPVAPTTQS